MSEIDRKETETHQLSRLDRLPGNGETEIEQQAHSGEEKLAKVALVLREAGALTGTSRIRAPPGGEGDQSPAGVGTACLA